MSPVRGWPTGILLQGTAVEIAPGTLFRRAHGHVYVFEDLLWSDSARAVRGLDQVVSDVALVLAAERIDEEKGFGQLPGSNQETRTVNVPFGCSIPHVIQPWGREDDSLDVRRFLVYENSDSLCEALRLGETFSWLVFVAGDENLLALKQWVNSIRLVQQHQSGM